MRKVVAVRKEEQRIEKKEEEVKEELKTKEEEVKEEVKVKEEEVKEEVKIKEEAMLRRFARALGLFMDSKRMKWLTVVFIIGLVWMTFIDLYGIYFIPSSLLVPVTVVTGGLWPVFFMLTSLMALIRLERLVASQTSYAKSLSIFLPWATISILLLMIIWSRFSAAFLLAIFGVAFFGWISFQAFFATRTSLHYADDIFMKSHMTLIKIISVLSNFLCYAMIIGSFYYTVFILNPTEIIHQPRELPLIVGMLFALGFNVLNLEFMIRHRHTTVLDNLALFGLFISLYSAYFIYEAGKPTSASFNLVSASISLFFVIYAMGSVGETLSERSLVRRHWTLSAEASVTLTFFLASGYYFASTFLSVLYEDPNLASIIGVTIKLLMFPFVAAVTEAHHMLRRIGAPPERAASSEREQGPPTQDEADADRNE
ncbi:MAG: hypothetical protein C4K49_05715 [Candidatus Thorarchaeota archaeon]|nr:MAG: hypothetical protein C4K49_05715 [Candidatus Thorarchaeota archaeon]